MPATIFDEIREDHNKVRQIIQQLKDPELSAVETEALVKTLREEVETHAKVEERVYYMPLFNSDTTQDKTRHSTSEHQEIDDALLEFVKTDRSSLLWRKKLNDLGKVLEHHVYEEEHSLFQLSGKVLSPEEQVEMGKVYRQQMEAA